MHSIEGDHPGPSAINPRMLAPRMNESTPSPGPCTRLLGSGAEHPLIICFHGSGPSATALAGWEVFAEDLSRTFRLLLYDRGDAISTQQSPEDSVHGLDAYLTTHGLAPPYVLVAHSYGGCIARLFLAHHGPDVAGLVLAETGQETALDAQLELRQYRRGGVLGRRPVSVIRANSLIWKWREYGAAVERTGDGDAAAQAVLGAQKEFLERVDREDERLKRKQLELSRVSRYVHLPDCGHNVVKHRPDVVAEEVRWVVKAWEDGQSQSWWRKLATFHQ